MIVSLVSFGKIESYMIGSLGLIGKLHDKIFLPRRNCSVAMKISLNMRGKGIRKVVWTFGPCVDHWKVVFDKLEFIFKIRDKRIVEVNRCINK